MKSKHAGRPRHRWNEALLGGLAGLGVPVLLRGGAHGRKRSNPAAVGVVAGLLGALVGGGLARRRRGPPAPAAPEQRSQEPEQERAREPEPHRREAPEPRRGPSGRERLWLLPEAPAHTS